MRNPIKITYLDKTQTIKQWAEQLGVSPDLLYTRYRLGWPPERMMTEPVNLNKSHHERRPRGNSSKAINQKETRNYAVRTITETKQVGKVSGSVKQKLHEQSEKKALIEGHIRARELTKTIEATGDTTTFNSEAKYFGIPQWLQGILCVKILCLENTPDEKLVGQTVSIKQKQGRRIGLIKTVIKRGKQVGRNKYVYVEADIK